MLSLFSGIGAFEKALQRKNIPYELVNYCEFNKYPSIAYSHIHNVSLDKNLGDISKVSLKDLPSCDLVTYGFPCQDISNAGLKKGIIKGETRSGLLYYALDIIEEKKPKYAICENVKHLVSKDFISDFQNLLNKLNELGYNNYWKVINSKDHSIPQSRERVFVVSIRKDLNQDFNFPKDKPLNIKLKDLLVDNVDESYYVNKDRINVLLKEILDLNCIAVREGTLKGYSEANEGDSINITYPHSIIRRGRVGKQMVNTLLTQTQICVVEKNKQTTLEKKLLDYVEKNKDIPEFFNAYNQRTFENVAPTITTTIGNPSSINGMIKCEGISKNNIITYNIPNKVRVRKYEVNKEELKELLSKHKKLVKISNREISRKLNMPQTIVDHWFRGDDSFSIPHPEIWLNLKELLKIDTNKFDESIMTFEEKEGNYDKSKRIYDVEGNIPTLTTTCKEHTIIDLENFKIRKLIPLETWRLMGFDDIDFYNAKIGLIHNFYLKGKNKETLKNSFLKDKENLEKKYEKIDKNYKLNNSFLNELSLLINTYYKSIDKSDSQLYKMAGNSIVVNVLEDIFEELFLK